jgi:hypothetical protein
VIAAGLGHGRESKILWGPSQPSGGGAVGLKTSPHSPQVMRRASSVASASRAARRSAGSAVGGAALKGSARVFAARREGAQALSRADTESARTRLLYAKWHQLQHAASTVGVGIPRSKAGSVARRRRIPPHEPIGAPPDGPTTSVSSVSAASPLCTSQGTWSGQKAGRVLAGERFKRPLHAPPAMWASVCGAGRPPPPLLCARRRAKAVSRAEAALFREGSPQVRATRAAPHAPRPTHRPPPHDERAP